MLDPFFGTGTTGVMAKRLGRQYVGIECEKKYVRMAQARIAAVTPAQDLALHVEKLRQPRVSIRVTRGVRAASARTATVSVRQRHRCHVLANGHIRCKDLTGSIHGVAKSLMGAPLTRWDVWYYKDEDGKKKVIDELREKVRTSYKL